jgi:glycosyltransferase involved in cell wall biosynthesis
MTYPISILILDNSYTFGGAINSLSYLLGALDREKYLPVLVSGQDEEFLKKKFDCIWYHYIPKLPWVDNRIYKRIAKLSLFRPRIANRVLNFARFFYWLLFITIPESIGYYRIGRRHHVDLVHLNNNIGSQLSGILAARFLGIPCIAHLRCFEDKHTITRTYARFVQHHIAISRAVRENLLHLGICKKRISLVHDALDLSEFEPNQRSCQLLDEFRISSTQPTFGIFGRVVDWKGIREFVLAARIVIQTFPEARGFIVGGVSDGDKNFYLEIKKLVDECALNDKVIFTGYRPDVPDLLNLMDVVVHASNCPEPFGMVIIEGMAMCKPIVATSGGGPLDIVIDGESGYIVEMGNSDALGDAIVSLLSHPDTAKKMGLCGRNRVENVFSNKRYAERVGNIYQKVAHKEYCKI